MIMMGKSICHIWVKTCLVSSVQQSHVLDEINATVDVDHFTTKSELLIVIIIVILILKMLLLQ